MSGTKHFVATSPSNARRRCHTGRKSAMRLSWQSRISSDKYICFRNRLQQLVQDRLSEPLSIPGATSSADDDVCDFVFRGESRDGADDVGPLERHLDSAQLLDQGQ